MSNIAATQPSDADHNESEAIFRLIYGSKGRIAAAAAQSELANIFSKARAKNKTAGITGALMMHGQRFAQVLEGPEDKVRGLFTVIQADPRHEAVEVTQAGQVAGRLFGKWAMAEVKADGEADIPVIATRTGLAEAEAWKITAAQEEVLSQLRAITRA